jgi:release factor glutamine methyltransferase
VIPGLKADASVAEALDLMTRAFRSASIDEAEADARVLAGHALRLDRAKLIAQSDRVLDAREIAAISALAARRLAREPVSRILGQREFWSLALSVTPDVLVPRPETETLVEAGLDFVVRSGLRMEKLKVLDIGTGSGALLLALLSELPAATGTGTDISAEALAVARANAAQYAFESRCNFLNCDIASAAEGQFDLVVSNPPYIAHGEIASLAREVKDYDPKVALDGGEDGLAAYRSIAAQVRRFLAPGGRLFVEIGIGQEPTVRAIFTEAGLTVGKARDDLGGIPRVLGAGFAS